MTEMKTQNQNRRICKQVATEIEEQIQCIYDALDIIRDELRRAGGGVQARANAYWLAHIDGALLNRGGYLGGSFVSAADTLEELREDEDEDEADEE